MSVRYVGNVDYMSWVADILWRICGREKESGSCIVVNHGDPGHGESGLVFLEVGIVLGTYHVEKHYLTRVHITCTKRILTDCRNR